ncbi:MAG: hypothetical protein INQ03_07845 [Candidatus Heimdallarchaeota archaeon]|nr:hypothetical protein [Candidatus Heimdallarchaeota archaeon]
MSEITQEEIDQVSKRNLLGLSTVGLACCGGTVSVALLQVPILGAIIGSFGIGLILTRIIKNFRN